MPVYEWKQNELEMVVQDEVTDNVTQACQHLVSYCKELISIQGKNYPPVHSTPGQPPFRISGHLQSSIKYKIDVGQDAVTGTVYSDSPYAGHLEMGTGKMAARPFMRPTFDNNQQEILNIVGGSKGGNIGF